MDENKKNIKTYISEANQNNISETLSVEENSQQATKKKESSEPDLQADEMSTGGAIPPQSKSQEPEILSAETTDLPPTTATAEAEAVAGLPVGSTYGEEGEIKIEKSSKHHRTKKENS
jgi:hypothetical protein